MNIANVRAVRTAHCALRAVSGSGWRAFSEIYGSARCALRIARTFRPQFFFSNVEFPYMLKKCAQLLLHVSRPE